MLGATLALQFRGKQSIKIYSILQSFRAKGLAGVARERVRGGASHRQHQRQRCKQHQRKQRRLTRQHQPQQQEQSSQHGSQAAAGGSRHSAAAIGSRGKARAAAAVSAAAALRSEGAAGTSVCSPVPSCLLCSLCLLCLSSCTLWMIGGTFLSGSRMCTCIAGARRAARGSPRAARATGGSLGQHAGGAPRQHAGGGGGKIRFFFSRTYKT